MREVISKSITQAAADSDELADKKIDNKKKSKKCRRKSTGLSESNNLDSNSVSNDLSFISNNSGISSQQVFFKQEDYSLLLSKRISYEEFSKNFSLNEIICQTQNSKIQIVSRMVNEQQHFEIMKIHKSTRNFSEHLYMNYLSRNNLQHYMSLNCWFFQKIMNRREYYLIMEKAHCDLDKYLRTDGQNLEIHQRLNIMDKLIETALDLASRKLIYTDFKPQQFLVFIENEAVKIKLSDFGSVINKIEKNRNQNLGITQIFLSNDILKFIEKALKLKKILYQNDEYKEWFTLWEIGIAYSIGLILLQILGLKNVQLSDRNKIKQFIKSVQQKYHQSEYHQEIIFYIDLIKLLSQPQSFYRPKLQQIFKHNFKDLIIKNQKKLEVIHQAAEQLKINIPQFEVQQQIQDKIIQRQKRIINFWVQKQQII